MGYIKLNKVQHEKEMTRNRRSSFFYINEKNNNTIHKGRKSLKEIKREKKTGKSKHCNIKIKESS